MNPLKSVATGMLNWSVERKMTIMLLGGFVGFPLTSFILLQTKGHEYTTTFLILLLVSSIILVVPFSKWMSHVVALQAIKELNDQCQKLKEGNYSQVELPPVEMEGHDFLTLKRNMHWMGHSIATRERKLQTAMSELAIAQRQIGESLDYARLIQTSFLPNRVDLFDYIPNHFLLWEQRDAVGGDAYWLKPTEKGFFLGVIDCTGHGVPGAFMTLIVTSLMEKAAMDGTTSPAEILGRMNRLIKDALGQNDQDAKSDDGMDCALCHVSADRSELVFAGANSPLYVVGEDGARRIRGDRCGLGYICSSRDFDFSDLAIQVNPSMRFYLASDGLTDQVGGERSFPFGNSRVMEFIEDRRHLSLHEQGVELAHVFEQYQGDEKRRDDVTVIGFEL